MTTSPLPGKDPAANWNYTLEELVRALRDTGLRPGDTVYSHLALLNLGMAREFRMNYHPARMIRDAIAAVIGPEGTFITPTYSYSFCSDEIYDPVTTPSKVGVMGDWLRCQEGVIRSLDPIFSCCGFGPRAGEILRDLPPASFGDDCVYSRLEAVNARICNFGLTLHWCTGIYYFDRLRQVPGRYDKIFPGKILLDGRLLPLEWTYYVRACIPETIPDFHVFHREAVKTGLARSAPVGRSFVCSAPFREFHELYDQMSRNNPWVSVVGPPCDVAAAELRRTGEQPYRITAGSGSSPREFLECLAPLPRDELSLAVQNSLEALSRVHPLQITARSSGEHCGPFTVPEGWHLRSAAVRDLRGNPVLDGEKAMGSCLRFSQPFSGTVTRDELLEHLIAPSSASALTGLRTAARPGTSFYRSRGWGFTRDAVSLESLSEEEYQVTIDSIFYYSRLLTAEALWEPEKKQVPDPAGNSRDTVPAPEEHLHELLFLTRIDGAYEMSAGLSGAVAGVFLMRRLAQAQFPGIRCRLMILSGDELLPERLAALPPGKRELVVLNRLSDPDPVLLACAGKAGDGSEPGLFARAASSRVAASQGRILHCPREAAAGLFSTIPPEVKDGDLSCLGAAGEYGSGILSGKTADPALLESRLDLILDILGDVSREVTGTTGKEQAHTRTDRSGRNTSPVRKEVDKHAQ